MKSAEECARLSFAKALVATVILAIAAGSVISQTPPFRRNTTSLNIIRLSHTATLLPNGKVMVAGGRDNDGNALASAELYDPVSEAWTITGSLHLSRSGHAAVLLGSGKVLVVGGVGAESSAELYDPVTGTWTVSANLHSPKVHQGTFTYPPGLVMLPNGKVLAVGGGSAELYDPAIGTWTITGAPNTMGNAATLLQSGKVLLVVGGTGSQAGTAELYDPALGSWTLTGSLNSNFDHTYEPTLTLLQNGKVLAVGGQSGPPGTAELYDPTSGTWVTAGYQGIRRQYGHTATLLNNGAVIVVGGKAVTLPTTDVKLYDPVSGIWSNAPGTAVPRVFHTSTLLGNGKVLVAGGNFATAELYDDGFEVVVLTSDQVAIKTWTYQGITYAYVKLSFPNAGYRVANWRQAIRSGNVFAADALVERFTGPSVQAVTTTAQIYDLGPLADGNYTFTFKNSETTVKSQAFSVSSAATPPNPIDDAREFVKWQYRDFLNREPDGPGWDFWTGEITQCTTDPSKRLPGESEAQCIIRKRANTSAAFFLSPEFQNTGYFVLRVYRGSLGRMPYYGGSVPADNTKDEFTRDHATVSAGIVVNNQLDHARMYSNKQAFVNQFITRSDFLGIYGGLNNEQYVDKLFETTAVAPTSSERQALINGLTSGSETRASVLFKIVDGRIEDGPLVLTTRYGKLFYDQQLNPGFVQMEYFGYLKRDPDDAGYAFWLAKLNQFGGNFVDAQMVMAFVLSPEYRARFGQP